MTQEPCIVGVVHIPRYHFTLDCDLSEWLEKRSDKELLWIAYYGLATSLPVSLVKSLPLRGFNITETVCEMNKHEYVLVHLRPDEVRTWARKHRPMSFQILLKEHLTRAYNRTRSLPDVVQFREDKTLWRVRSVLFDDKPHLKEQYARYFNNHKPDKKLIGLPRY